MKPLEPDVTVKETSFFRDLAPFQVLRERLLPELMQRCREQRRLRIWSAACSTGQEAYSLAMLLREHFPETENWDVRIAGTDISQAACDYAARGSYGRLEVQRGLTARYRMRYFECDGEGWKVREELRRMVGFERADLRHLPAAGAKFDLVLLRNALLYMTGKERTRVLTDVHARMQCYAPLLLGNAEQAEDCCELFGLEFDRACYFYRPLMA